MPSIVVDMDPATATIAADRADAVVIPTSMVIDNDGGGADRTIKIQDVFTASVTNGDSSPSADKTVDRFRITVIQGDIISLSEEDLKGVKCLGKMQVNSDAVDAACYVTVGYKHE
ncbi:hypothetical protein LCGC14_2888790 [marine sediment metagenome]|uniref:Uncharacterized protein n=1 Tax=marine sediment metagenome TaxID=412755 RepID=A0A0F8XXX4_9ZZZZ